MVQYCTVRVRKKNQTLTTTTTTTFFFFVWVGGLRLGHGLDDVGVTGVGDGHAGHAVVATAGGTEVDVVCGKENRKEG